MRVSKQIRYYFNNQTIFIELEQNVWPPYSAFDLFEAGLPFIDKVVNDQKGNVPLICDIGTGSGILAILAKTHFPNIRCIVTDLSPNAIECAVNNWKRNGLPQEDIIKITEDGIGHQLINLVQENGGANVVIANLPQQPFINFDSDLTKLNLLRKESAAAWNYDGSNDPDGLGIFMSVIGNAYKIMKKGGIVIASASSKQNYRRWSEFLNGLKKDSKINDWKIISTKDYPIPSSYDPRLIEYWLEKDKEDRGSRLFKDNDGQYRYTHYNLVIYY